MKYSLELSDPWHSQYHSDRENGGMDLFRKSRELQRLWITYDGDELQTSMVNTSTLRYLQGWRYVKNFIDQMILLHILLTPH